MTLSAMRIKVRTGALFQRSSHVCDGGQVIKTRDACLAEGRSEQANAIKRTKLIVGDAREVTKTLVKLASFHTQHVMCRRRMTREAINPAGIVPCLRPGRVIRIGDGDVLIYASVKQIGVAIVWTPLVSNPVNGTRSEERRVGKAW